MRVLMLLVVAMVFAQAVVFAQDCLPGGITFTTQEQIDNFQTNYPGCSEIEGSVIISGAGITNLEGLNVLVSIGGDLEIKLNELLVELTGLQNLEYLGGNLRIEDNGVLENLLGLENLAILNGDLIIGDIVWGQYPYSTGNPLLTSLAGLNNLATIQGNLKLCGNFSLSSLSGLENLAYIGGNLQVGGLEFVYGFTFGNPLLVNFSGLTRLNAIGGSLFVAGNISLTDLSGLDSLTSVGLNCWFDLNESLSSLQGLNQLTSIGGSLKFRWNITLSNISGTGNIAAQTIQELEIIYNHALTECNIKSICSYLAFPNGTAEIYGNAPGCNSPEEVEAACNEVSVESTGTGDEILLFPNPAGKTVTISSNKFTTIQEMVIYNQTGQKVMLGKPVSNTLDISKLRPGMYITEMVINQRIVMKRLMVK